jgi:hypothetical protein
MEKDSWLNQYQDSNPGQLVWDMKIEKDKVFVKCANNTWVFFKEISLPFGKMAVPTFVQKVLRK